MKRDALSAVKVHEMMSSPTDVSLFQTFFFFNCFEMASNKLSKNVYVQALACPYQSQSLISVLELAHSSLQIIQLSTQLEILKEGCGVHLPLSHPLTPLSVDSLYVHKICKTEERRLLY